MANQLVAGFDYGTSHCSLAVLKAGQVQLATLEDTKTMVPSTLWAPKINLDLRYNAQQRLDASAETFTRLQFGEAALARYLDDPTEGYFVKSPKSFLGAPGLSGEVQERFVAIVAAMMANVRERATAEFAADLFQVVIGRPVNFQAISGQAENEQAIHMLTAAAKLAGFEDVQFLYEPMAAAIEYEAKLECERLVLVVDIGGGTTDCSFVRVGPKLGQQLDRSEDVIGHSGERLGGNDYDQALALEAVMPQFGFGATLINERLVPNHYLVDAVSTNDVNAQQRFYSADTNKRLQQLCKEAQEPVLLQRLLGLCEQRGSYRLLRSVEQAKIQLSEHQSADVLLDFVEQGLKLSAQRKQFLSACKRLLERLDGTINEVLEQSSSTPDVVYLTGGMAKASIVRQYLKQRLQGIELLDSDHFSSVTQGLTLWANRLYGPGG